MPYVALPRTAPLFAHPEALPEGEGLDALRQSLAGLDQAEAHGHPVVRCEALTQTARCLAGLHAYPEAEACLHAALAAARQLATSQDLQADLLCALAEVACNEADLVTAREQDDLTALARQRQARLRARQWAEAAAEMALHTTDTAWQVLVLMRAADVLERGGETDDAVTLHRQALAISSPPKPSRWSQPAGLRHSAPRQLM